ncbi:MAG: hypothetical protein EZS28_004421 [Streblomastix strix]|nr:MAG: hypothetical protein EZS28_004421 [Streblomastix strix]
MDVRLNVPRIEISVNNLQMDETRFINLNIVLLKRIRVMGGVQSLVADPSMLVVFNGKAVFIFGFQTGDILDDNKENGEKKKLINTRNDFCSCTTSVYNEQQQISTTFPYHFDVSEVRNIHDFLLDSIYSTVTTVQSPHLTQTKNSSNSFINPETEQSNIKANPYPVQADISSDRTVIMSPAVQARSLYLKLLTFIVAPSYITSFSIHPIFGRQYMYLYDSFEKHTDRFPRYAVPFPQFMDYVRNFLHPYYQRMWWIMRFSIAYAPCGIMMMDFRYKEKYPFSVETEIKNIQKFCIFKPNSIHESLKGGKRRNLNNFQHYSATLEILKKSTQNAIHYIPKVYNNSETENDHIKRIENKLKPPSLVPLLIASQKLMKMKQTFQFAGQILTQDEEELVFSHYAQQSEIPPQDEKLILSHTPECFLTLIAHGHTPSLLTSMQMLDMNNIAVVADREVLIYSLLPNSFHPHNWGLFRKLKNTQKEIEEQKRIAKKRFVVTGIGIEEDEQSFVDEIKAQQMDEELRNIKLNRANVEFSIKGHPVFSLVLSIRIPTENNVTYLFPSSIGLHSLFGGMHGQLMRRLSKLSSKMRQDCDEMSVYTATTIDNASESREQYGKCEMTKTITAQISYAAIRRLMENQRRLEEQLQQSGSSQQNHYQMQQFDAIRADYSLKRRSLLLERETNSLMMSTHALTPINAMQILPEIPSFVMLSKSGWCARSVPFRYEQLPLRDLSMMTDTLLQLQQNFGNIWIDNQIKLIQDYNSFEEKNWRKYVMSEIRNELEETGTLMLIPKHPIMHYVQPIFPAKNGRFIDGDLVFGLSPLPLTAEFLQARTMDPWQLRKSMTLLAAEDDIRRRWRLSERDRIRKILKLSPPPDIEEAEHILIDRKQKKEREMFINSTIATEQMIVETQHAQYLSELRSNQFVEKASDFIQKQSTSNDKSIQCESFINSFSSIFSSLSKFRSHTKSSPPQFLVHSRYQLPPDFINLELGMILRQPFINSLINTLQPEFRNANAVLTSIAAGTLRQQMQIRSIEDIIVEEQNAIVREKEEDKKESN